MKRFSFVVALIALVATLGCGFDKDKGILMAAGSYGDLAVVVSDRNMQPLAQRFTEGLNIKKTFVIKEEGLFNPDIFLPNQLDMGKGYKNVILLLRIGDGGPVEKTIKKKISDKTWNQLASGAGGMVQLNDPWATYQTVVVVASRDRNSLSSMLRKKTSRIRDLFEESSRQRILRRNRYKGLDTGLMNAYRERFGFTLEIPAEFKQNQLKPGGFPGLELLTSAPSRGISISWMATEDVEWLMGQRDALHLMRQEMGEKLHSEDIIPETLVWENTTLGGAEVLKLEGAWTSKRFAGGGAFWCYFIPDPARNRVICLDLLVYGPGLDKMPMFRNLAAVASSFSFQQ